VSLPTDFANTHEFRLIIAATTEIRFAIGEKRLSGWGKAANRLSTADKAHIFSKLVSPTSPAKCNANEK